MAYKTKILLIEDEEDIAALIKLQAEVSGYSLHVEVDGINGYLACERVMPDLIILDVMLPGENGFDVCRKIKNNPRLKHIPVIMLSAKDKEIDIILGLELGADDYVSKPFSPKVLFSKTKAILRRKAPPSKGKRTFSFGSFDVDIDRYMLSKNNIPLSITLSEFGILKRLLTNKGKVLTRNQLLDDVNNDHAYIVDRNIDVHIAALRKKLGPDFDWIETVRGIGYRFRDNPTPTKA